MKHLISFFQTKGTLFFLFTYSFLFQIDVLDDGTEKFHFSFEIVLHISFECFVSVHECHLKIILFTFLFNEI